MAGSRTTWARNRDSLPPVCVSFSTGDARQLFSAAEHEAQQGHTFFEVHLDCFPDVAEALDVTTCMRRRFPSIFLLATCRREGGMFRGDAREQIGILQQASGNGADALDLELETAEEVPELIPQLRNHAQLMISYHNYLETPPLPGVWRRLAEIPADWYKVVTTATRFSANPRLLHFAATMKQSGVVTFAMGEMGVASRILSPSYGSLYTYAAPAQLPANAPGQLSTHALSRYFNIGAFSHRARKYAVIGDAPTLAQSCALHNRSFLALGMDAISIPLTGKSLDCQDLLETIRDLGIYGFTVAPELTEKMLRLTNASAGDSGPHAGTFWKTGNQWNCTNSYAQTVRSMPRPEIIANAAQNLEIWTGLPAPWTALEEAYGEIQASNLDRIDAVPAPTRV